MSFRPRQLRDFVPTSHPDVFGKRVALASLIRALWRCTGLGACTHVNLATAAPFESLTC